MSRDTIPEQHDQDTGVYMENGKIGTKGRVEWNGDVPFQWARLHKDDRVEGEYDPHLHQRDQKACAQGNHEHQGA